MATISIGAFSVVMEVLTMWYLCESLLVRKPFFRRHAGVYLVLVTMLSLGNTLFAVNKYWMLVGCIIISAMVPLGMYEGSIFLRIFTICIVFAVTVGMERATKYLLAFLYGGAEMRLDSPFYQLQGTVLSKFAALIVMRVLMVCKKATQHILPAKVLVMLMIFPIATVLCIIQLMDPSYLVEESHIYLRIFMTICLLILANVVIFYTFDALAQHESDKRQLLLARSQYTQQVRFYERLSEEKRLTEQMRHDLKHTLLILAGYLHEGQDQAALAYINELQNDLQMVRVETTGVLAWDIVIADKGELAKRMGSTLNVNAFITSAIMVKEVDIAILLANALDNAIEATTLLDDALIQLNIKVDEAMIDIILTNPIAHDRIISGDSLTTTKTDGDLHGIGLSSIRRIAERYHGHMMLSAQDKIFTLDITLSNNAPSDI